MPRRREGRRARRAQDLPRKHRRRLVRGDQLGAPAPAFRQRPAPERSRQLVRRRRAPLHGAHQLGPAGDLEGAKPDPVPEDARRKRLLLGRRRLRLPARPHSNARQDRRADAARGRLLAHDGGPPQPEQPRDPRPVGAGPRPLHERKRRRAQTAAHEAEGPAHASRHARAPDPEPARPRRAHSNRRRRPPGRHRPVRNGSEVVRPRRRLQGARPRQPLRRGHELLPLLERGEPGADRDGECPARRRSPARAARGAGRSSRHGPGECPGPGRRATVVTGPGSPETDEAMQRGAAETPLLTRDPMNQTSLIRRLTATPVAKTDAHEGPVYVAEENALYFTTVRTKSVAIKRLALADWKVSVLRADANVANGMALDPEGRLVVCEQGTLTEPARITRIDRKTGAVETIVDAWRGLPLNSPNDVVVKSDGTIWFTDPSYGHLQGFRPEPQTGDHVYRYDPAGGQLTVVADSLDKPNGLAFSPDERVLYVGDNGAPHHLLAFDVEDGARLAGVRAIAVSTPEHPDGLKTDSEGRIYASYSGGVQVLDSSGELIGEINLPGAVNFTFGGPERNVLYITADTAVWAVVLNAKGA